MSTPTKPRKGRPTLPESERASVAYNVRLTPAQRKKVDRLGGAAWIRAQIEKAREVKSE